MNWKMGMVFVALLLAGCGDDGDDGPVSMTFDAVPSIVAVDFTNIGAPPGPSGFYFSNTVYGLTPGRGTIFWADATTFWFRTITIEPGTSGDSPPLAGLLLQDGDKGRERRYSFFFFQGSYTKGNTILIVSPPGFLGDADAPILYPIQRK